MKYGFVLQVEVTSDNAAFGSELVMAPPPAVLAIPDTKQFSVKASKLH